MTQDGPIDTAQAYYNRWASGLSVVPKPKLLLLGHARHGKDTAAEILARDFGFSFISSSLFCAEKVVRPYLAGLGMHYATTEECYNDRQNMRPEWHIAIWDYNQPDRARLAKEIFAQHDLYVGLRHDKEFFAVKNSGLCEASIWIDRSDHYKPEPRESMKIEKWMADFIVDNNGTVEDLTRNLHQLMRGQKWA